MAKQTVTITGFITGFSQPDGFRTISRLTAQTQTIGIVIAEFIVPFARITTIVSTLMFHFAAIAETIIVLATNGTLVNDKLTTPRIAGAPSGVAFPIIDARINFGLQRGARREGRVAIAVQTIGIDLTLSSDGELDLTEPIFGAAATLTSLVDGAGGAVGLLEFTLTLGVAIAGRALEMSATGKVLGAVRQSESGKGK